MPPLIRLAIFEDNDELRRNLALFLNWDEAIEVVGQFANAVDIEAHIAAACPDVVLMDIDMPGANGIEGIARLRKVAPSIQVMMLTVFEDDDNIFAAIRAGANGYLLKKTPPAEILEAVKELHAGGSPMSGSIARRVLRHFQPAPAEPGPALTAREQEILGLLVRGNSYKMIAAAVGISPNTVRNHIHKIYEKLHVNSATEAAYKALGSTGGSPRR
ncbi:response regulator transcription factor [Flaviaesturariibacter amylovorans]|uniref:Response regulator transcription factor n=1 Tax=Flaviaesturariibacter amylovorans TaxID=1084520 RepID=A0ABP8HHJ7_9BACT